MKKEQLTLSSVPQYNGLTRSRVQEMIEKIVSLKVGVIGDGCLDMYWHADMTASELSRETPHHNLPIFREQYSLGAAGNVAANFRALGCKQVYFCSIIGQDWRGELFQSTMQKEGIDQSYILKESQRVTPAYCKTIRHGLQNVSQEDPRLDFTNRMDCPDEMIQSYIRLLDQMADQVDVMSVTDQLQHGVVTPLVRDRLQYWAAQGKIIVIDSRDRIGQYKGLITKPNEIEALRWYYGSLDYQQPKEDELIKAGLQLSKSTGAPSIMTLGEQGALWFEGNTCTYVPTVPVPPPVDIVGAGDTFTSAVLSAMGVGSKGPEAVAFAHLASGVSIQKLGRAGTATPKEMLQLFDDHAPLQSRWKERV